MKSERMEKIIGDIDEDLIVSAQAGQKHFGKSNIIRWTTIAAAACLVLVVMFAIWPKSLTENEVSGNPPTTNRSGIDGATPVDNYGELAAHAYYKYAVDEGKYSTYVMGRGIHTDYVGDKICDVTVTAGWIYSNGGEFWLANEHARAEIYRIIGVSEDTAVAICFLDELEAEIVGCYYVIINPEADSTPVSQYVITQESNEQNLNDGVAE